MAIGDQGFREVRNYPLRASIPFRRNTFIEWGDLSNSHLMQKLHLACQ